MKQVVRIAQTIAVPVIVVIEFAHRAFEFLAFLDKPLSRESLALHEIDIGAANRALGQRANPLMVIQQRWQVFLLREQGLPRVAGSEGVEILLERPSVERLDNMKHLFGVFLVGDQRAKPGRTAVWMDEHFGH